MTDVEHAQRYRSIPVADLADHLSRKDEGTKLFAHPITGVLVVTDVDGEWLELIRATRDGFETEAMT